MTDYTIGMFNSYNKHLKFTVEKPVNNMLNFLESSLIITENNVKITN